LNIIGNLPVLFISKNFFLVELVEMLYVESAVPRELKTIGSVKVATINQIMHEQSKEEKTNSNPKTPP